jgi:hypothetical protein
MNCWVVWFHEKKIFTILCLSDSYKNYVESHSFHWETIHHWQDFNLWYWILQTSTFPLCNKDLNYLADSEKISISSNEWIFVKFVEAIVQFDLYSFYSSYWNHRNR